MKQALKIEMVGLTAAVCLSILLASFLGGCSKKENPPAKPPVDTNSQQSKTLSPAAATDTNQSSQVLKALAKEPAKPSESPPALPSASTASALKQFDSLPDSDKKIDFISEYTDAHPEAVVAIANRALDDKDEDVRLAAIEALADKELAGAEVIPLVQKALKDSSEQVRQSALEACSDISNPQVGQILVQALADESEDVRSAALAVADEKDAPVRLEVLKAAIISPHQDVKDGAVSSLTDMSSPESLDVLITGLKDQNPEFHQDVRSAIDFLVSQDFETYDQAKQWWDANRNKFDEELSEKAGK